MSDEINAFFQLLTGWLGLQPASIAALALVLVLVFAVLLLYLLARLRNSRGIVHQLAKRLGYEPPYGDGEEVCQQEFRNELIQRGREMKIKRLEQRVAELEAAAETKDANLGAFQQRYTELDDQLQQATLRQEELTAQAGDRAQAHQSAIAQLEQRLRDMETEGYANRVEFERRSSELEDQLQQATLRAESEKSSVRQQLVDRNTCIERLELQVRDLEAEVDLRKSGLKTLQAQVSQLELQLQQASLRDKELVSQIEAQTQGHQAAVDRFEQRLRDLDAESFANLAELEHRSRELEEQLHRASIRNEEVTAQAGERAQAHRSTIAQLEERIRDLEAESSTSLAALQQHARALEDQLQQAHLHHEELATQSAGQTQVHQQTVAQLEQRIRDLEAESSTGLAALQQHARALEDQLQQAHLHHEELATQSAGQTQVHQQTVAQLEQRIRDLEAESSTGLAALQQHARALEDQLQQAHLHHEELATQSAEQTQVHQQTVAQLEQRIRDLEAESSTGLAALQQHARALEDQLQQAHLHHEELATQSAEQTQVHQQTVAQLEQRIRDLEAESSTGLAALRQHARALEDQLEQAAFQTQNERSTAYQETLDQIAATERLDQRIRDLESEIEGRESGLQILQARVRELEDQLQHAADQAAEAILAAPSVRPPLPEGQSVVPGSSIELLHRAEWITACAVGAIRPLGLVAAEAYAAAAIAADPHSSDARRLLAELARLRPASPRFLPSVVEAVTTFDEAAAAFFGPNLARAADFAEKEAIERYRAGLGHTALLVVNLALALRLQLGLGNTPDTLRLQQMKTALLARLSSTAKPSNHNRKLASL